LEYYAGMELNLNIQLFVLEQRTIHHSLFYGILDIYYYYYLTLRLLMSYIYIYIYIYIWSTYS